MTTTDPSKVLTFLMALSPTQVVKTYRGREGCMCGCRGEYRNDNVRSAAQCIGAIKKAILSEEGHNIGMQPGFDGETIVYFERDGRKTVLYTCPNA